MRIALILAILYSVSLSALSNTESEHFPAEFWQREDGKYCVKVVSDPDDESVNHIFVFDSISLDGG